MIRSAVLLLSAALLFAGAAHAADPAAATAADSRRDFSGYIVAAAEPQASEAAIEILKRGGTAIDAAVAAETVLGLVEPQSSGLGGGAFLLYRDAKTGKIETYDGRETAPAAATPDMFLNPDGTPMQFFDKVVGGKSVGVPGTIEMLALAHKEHGRLPWASLFEPAEKLAKDGYPLSTRTHDELSFMTNLKSMPGVSSYFFDKAGNPYPAGTIMHNPDYAKTLEALAKNPRALNEGRIAEDIVNAVAHAPHNPQAMTLADLQSYTPKERPPVCGPYRQYVVCGMGPPSSGGITTIQILTMLERFDLAKLGPENPESWHLIAEAERLAYADRVKWEGDSDVVDVPVAGLIDRDYLKTRASLIDPDHAAGTRAPGDPPHKASEDYAPGKPFELPGTTHFTIVDDEGNVAAMTASIEAPFGSELWVDGFLLNNELTDFSAIPTADGKPVANAVAPHKRPMSAMSPTLVTDKNGKLVMAIGSPGGPVIIAYVVKTIIGVLDWKLPIQQAIDLPNLVNMNGPTLIEDVAGADQLKDALAKMGDTVTITNRIESSGLQGFEVIPGGYEGGADKRREGEVLGEKPIKG